MASSEETGDRLQSALGDRYRVERKIGSGGMSSVYKAIDEENQQAVAVKVLPPGLDDATNFRLRFEREYALLTGKTPAQVRGRGPN